MLQEKKSHNKWLPVEIFSANVYSTVEITTWTSLILDFGDTSVYFKGYIYITKSTCYLIFADLSIEASAIEQLISFRLGRKSQENESDLKNTKSE